MVKLCFEWRFFFTILIFLFVVIVVLFFQRRIFVSDFKVENALDRRHGHRKSLNDRNIDIIVRPMSNRKLRHQLERECSNVFFFVVFTYKFLF